LLACASLAAAQTKLPKVDFTDSTLENGLRVIIVPDHTAPVVAVSAVGSLQEAADRANATPYGLQAGVFTRDRSELQYFLDNAQAGVLYANRASGATTGAWPGAQPFCGWKGTGVSGKGGLGGWFLPQFMREQSHTIMTK